MLWHACSQMDGLLQLLEDVVCEGGGGGRGISRLFVCINCPG